MDKDTVKVPTVHVKLMQSVCLLTRQAMPVQVLVENRKGQNLLGEGDNEAAPIRRGRKGPDDAD